MRKGIVRIGICGLLLLLGASNAGAQQEQRDSVLVPPPSYNKNLFITWTDGIATTVRHTGRKIRKVGREFNAIDTTYISPNLYNLAFMLEHSGWYEYYRLGSREERNAQDLSFAPNASFKLGVYFGWRWIFLGYSFDVEDIFGGHKNKAKKTEMALNIYSSKFGVDLYYRKTGSDFKIRSANGFELSTPIKNQNFDGFQSKIKGVNAYWIFNYKRFSYPAAYSQSTNQRKSAGSLMAGFSYSQHNVSFDYERLPEEVKPQLQDALRFHKVKYSDYSINIGYGYNWVFAKNCLANLSLLPAIAYKKSKIDGTTQTGNHWTKDINFDLITRAGIVYNDSRFFVGASLVMHTYDYRKQNFSLTNTFGTLRVYTGFNFWKKKEYRKPGKAKAAR